MSANERELREARQAERKEKKSAAAAEQEKKNRKYRTTTAIVIAIIVVLVVGAILINSNIFYTKTTAMTVGTTKYSPAEVSYFYRSTYNTVYQNIVNQFGDMASMLIDTSTPLSEQLYPYDVNGEQTWAEAIAETAKEDIVRITSFADAAEKAGRTLSADDENTISVTMESYKQYASINGFSNVDNFLAAYFGKGVNAKTVEKLQRRILLGSNYYNEVMESFQYTEDELRAYYSEHADDMDYYNFYVYTVYTSMDQFSNLEDDDAKLEQVHAAAQEIIDATTDPESFTAAVKAFAGEDTEVQMTSSTLAALSINYNEWITDPARQPGDTAVIDVSTNSYALYYVGRDKNDYNTVDFRHILIEAAADENGEYTEEALEAAKNRVEVLYAEWHLDPTEEHFAEMANSYSEDTGSNTNGGLYEQTTKNKTVPGINDFLFNEGHVAGDTGIVLGQSSSYTGYHIVYYVGDNEPYCNLLAESAKRNEDLEAKAAELAVGYDVVEGSGMRYVTDL